MVQADTVDYERRFGGMARLYGQAGLDRFSESHICVIGVGGVGSWAVEALARSGVGQLTLIDLDNVAESNVNRQLPAMGANFGKAKIVAMAERIADINPACQVTLIEDFVEIDNLQTLITTQFDWVIDCMDSFRTKAALIAHCRRQKIKIITVGSAGGQIDPTLIRQVDLARTEHDPLLAKTRKQLRQQYRFPQNPKRRFAVPCVYSDEQLFFPTADGGVCQTRSERANGGSGLNCGGFGSAMPVTATFGLVAVAHVLKKLSGRG